jgi:putative tryptophan/tyrosine transport system substrate-binding protein
MGRGFLRAAFLWLIIVAAPLVAEAQPEGKVWRIGLFHVGLDHVPPSLQSLREGLKALGYVDGKNLRLDWRNLPDEAAANETARDFVRQRVDLIVAFESQTVRAAKAATAEIPIVFLHVTDPVADGFVKSLAHPGSNLTGIGEFFSDLFSKRVEIFSLLVPRPKAILALTTQEDPLWSSAIKTAREAATALKVALVVREVSDRDSIETTFRDLRPGEVQGVLIVSSTLITKFPSTILEAATRRRVPVAFHRKEWVEQGALFSYGADFRSVGEDAAQYVDRIFKGASPAALPVQQISRFEFVINQKIAKTLGVTIPPSLLLRADKVIE